MVVIMLIAVIAHYFILTSTSAAVLTVTKIEHAMTRTQIYGKSQVSLGTDYVVESMQGKWWPVSLNSVRPV